MNIKLPIASFIFIALMLSGCDKGEPADSSQKVSEKERDLNSITVRPELADRLKIGQPSLIDLADKIQVPSRVQVDEERTAPVSYTHLTLPTSDLV